MRGAEIPPLRISDDSVRFLPHVAAIFRQTTCVRRQIGIITGSDGRGMKAAERRRRRVGVVITVCCVSL